jgi:hypothetical protein
MSSAQQKFTGQVYVGVIVSLGIFLILSQAVVSLIISGYDLISYSRARTTAKHLATEQLETIRNLTYADVGTVSGIPPANIPQTQIIVRNGLSYTINTHITYFDDPADQLAPDDTEPNDYKRVEVQVSWGGIAKSKTPITYVTNISPQYEDEFTGGTLAITVTDANGDPLPAAEVSIYADEISPIVDTTEITDSDGMVVLPGAAVCTSCYQISVTKSGYSLDRTYSTAEVPIPTKTHATVQENKVTELTFSIDKTSQLQIFSYDTKDNNFAVLPNQSFRLRGTKIIGTDSGGQFIYKFDHDIATDATGSATIEGIEWDSYYILPLLTPTKDIAATNPLNPIIVNPDEELQASYSASPATTNSLIVLHRDSNENPIASIAATLKDDAGYEEVYQNATEPGSVDYSQSFFNDLEEKNYTIYATASGYQPFTDTIYVNGYTTENIHLISQ